MVGRLEANAGVVAGERGAVGIRFTKLPSESAALIDRFLAS